MTSEIRRIHKQLVSKELSCTQLIEEKLELLKNSTENSASFIFSKEALEKAALVDKKISNGQSIGLLEGIPFGVKDVFLLQGQKATSSSDMLKDYVSPYTATAIQKLIDAGAIPIVKENCDAYGHGSTSENTIYGPVKNAINNELVAGGSSGGSAVNVAKNYTTFSIGGDTGGSIRQPAGYNKVCGLKPTYGRVSRYGIMAYASSTDCVGPFAPTVEDIAIILNTISGLDKRDQTTFESEPVELKEQSLKGVKIGYYSSFLDNPVLIDSIKTDFITYIETLKNKGATIVNLEFFNAETLVSTYYTLAMAETASNLSRLDGTNYGVRVDKATLKEGYLESRSANFSEETKRRIVGGNQVLSQGYADDIYLKARNIRTEISAKFEEDFSKVDLLLSPVAPNLPPKIGANLKDPAGMYYSDAYTVGFSLGGLPTITIPKGTEIGVQLTTNIKEDAKLLQFANSLNTLI